MSIESSSCRIDWRPSRLLCVAFAGLGLLAAIALCLSALPLPFKPALALLVAWRGFSLARAHWREPVRSLHFEGDGMAPLMREAGVSTPLAGASLVLRGPLALLRWREQGRPRALPWCADTLAPAARRELRLRLGAAAGDAA